MDQADKHGIARRAAVGVGRLWAYSLGITSLVRTGHRIWGRLDTGADYVRRKLADGPQNYRRESFNEAVERLGLDEADLERRACLYRSYAIWNFLAMMVATGWLAYVPFTDHFVNALLLTLCLIAAIGSQWLMWHYRYCQLRDRDLETGFGAWLMNPGRW